MFDRLRNFWKSREAHAGLIVIAGVCGGHCGANAYNSGSSLRNLANLRMKFATRHCPGVTILQWRGLTDSNTSRYPELLNG